MEAVEQALPPPHRSYVSVELPFLVAPAKRVAGGGAPGEGEEEDALAKAQRAEVEAFLPPRFLGPCLLSNRTTGHAEETGGAARKTRQGDFCVDSEGEEDRSSEEGGDGKSAGTNERSNRKAKRGNGPLSSPTAGSKGKVGKRSREGGDAAVDGGDLPDASRAGRFSLDVANPDAYAAAPIFTGWRPMDWGSTGKQGGEEDKEREGGDEAFADDVENGATFLERQRREVFPSLVPQVLVEGYCRNDLLVKVTRTKRVRRVRDAETGEVLSEEEVCSADPAHGASEGSTCVAPPTARVVGVVSRDVQLARPADFAFSLFRKEQVDAAPDCCSDDLFPPMRFLGKRAMYQVPYAMGAEVNTSVQGQQKRQLQLQEGGGSGAEEEDDDDNNNDHLRHVIVSLTVDAEAPNIPPPSPRVHKSYLAYLGCSPAVIARVVAGESAVRAPPGTAAADATAEEEWEEQVLDDCPAEVRVLSSFLASRPIWCMSELKTVMMNSGVCPRAFTNKQVITCMTYAIRNGSFNRLRIRMGYNPFASSRHSAIYQRLSVRLLRRSELGVQVRDLARSPHIQEAVKAIRRKHAALILDTRRQVEASRAAVDGERKQGGTTVACYGTLVELLCSVVSMGTLSVVCQFADLQDDAVFRELIARAAPASDMPTELRRNREGWLLPQAYHRAITHFSEALTTFLHDEVVPTVRQLSVGGEPPAQAPHDDDDDDEEEDEDDDDDDDHSSVSPDVSSSSSASSGNASGAPSPSLSDAEDDQS